MGIISFEMFINGLYILHLCIVRRLPYPYQSKVGSAGKITAVVKSFPFFFIYCTRVPETPHYYCILVFVGTAFTII